jgi:hypothetical protein
MDAAGFQLEDEALTINVRHVKSLIIKGPDADLKVPEQ